MDGEEHGASSAQPLGEPSRDSPEDLSGSGWTTTKQAAKVLGVSRRSVQGYVGRGILEAREEGEGVNRRFLISIDSLNALADRRRRDADETANFAEASPQSEETARPFANTGEELRHLIERLESRTAEATELRVRLEITERAQSTLEDELAAERRRREEAERERDELRQEQEAFRKSHEERPLTETRREPSPSALTTRLGMSLRALAIGVIAILLTWFYVFAVRLHGAHTLPGFNFYTVHLPNYVAMAPLVLVPLLFGLWAGSTKRPSLPWFSSPHLWLRRGGRSALEISIFAAGLPAWAGWAISSIYYLRGWEITPGVLTTIGFVYAVGALIWGGAGSLAFMSGAFLGNALGRVGIIGTPREPPEGEEESGSEEVWTPRQEGRWGLIGGIITASIPAIATVIAALLEGK